MNLRDAIEHVMPTDEPDQDEGEVITGCIVIVRYENLDPDAPNAIQAFSTDGMDVFTRLGILEASVHREKQGLLPADT